MSRPKEGRARAKERRTKGEEYSGTPTPLPRKNHFLREGIQVKLNKIKSFNYKLRVLIGKQKPHKYLQFLDKTLVLFASFEQKEALLELG